MTDSITESTQATPPDAEVSIEDRLLERLDPMPDDAPTSETDAKPGETDQSEPEATADDATEDASQVELDASELASMFGLRESQVSVSDDGKLRIKVNIEGEESEATLAELVRGYQTDGYVTRKSMELADQRKALEAQAAQQQTALAQQAQQAAFLLQTAEQQLIGEYQSIDWQRLRRENPAEYSAAQLDYSQRARQIEGMKEQALSITGQYDADAQAKQAQAYEAHLEAEKTALLEAVPEWKDEAKAEVGKAEIVTFLRESGFTPEEIGSIGNHKALLLIRDAMAYRKAAKSTDVTAKQLKKVVKPVLKPGAVQTKAEAARKQSTEARATLRKMGGNTDSVAALLLDRM